MTGPNWETELREIERSARSAVASAGTPAELEAVRVAVLGRKARLPLLLRGLKNLPLDERRVVGPRANALRGELEALLETRSRDLGAGGPGGSGAPTFLGPIGPRGRVAAGLIVAAGAAARAYGVSARRLYVGVAAVCVVLAGLDWRW